MLIRDAVGIPSGARRCFGMTYSRRHPATVRASTVPWRAIDTHGAAAHATAAATATPTTNPITSPDEAPTKIAMRTGALTGRARSTPRPPFSDLSV